MAKALDEDGWLARHGLRPAPAALPTVRARLQGETRRERRSQGEGDTEVMRLCCAQLFLAGAAEDILLIWRAKRASMDAAAAVDVQLMCGPGVAEARRWLQALATAEADEALAYFELCAGTGDFERVVSGEYVADLERYYGV